MTGSVLANTILTAFLSAGKKLVPINKILKEYQYAGTEYGIPSGESQITATS